MSSPQIFFTSSTSNPPCFFSPPLCLSSDGRGRQRPAGRLQAAAGPGRRRQARQQARSECALQRREERPLAGVFQRSGPPPPTKKEKKMFVLLSAYCICSLSGAGGEVVADARGGGERRRPARPHRPDGGGVGGPSDHRQATAGPRWVAPLACSCINGSFGCLEQWDKQVSARSKCISPSKASTWTMPPSSLMPLS